MSLELENIFSEFAAVAPAEVASRFLEPPADLKLAGRAPRSVAEVTRIVELAAKNDLKVFTGSGYGFPREVADIPGVFIDFRNLSSVRQVDGRNLFGGVERGVTFPALVKTLAEQDFRPGLPIGSLSAEAVTSYLNRETVWDGCKFPEARIGPLEVVLADGRVQQTGAHALSLKTVPWTGEGGPYFSQWYQGSRDAFGIVVSGKVLIYPRWGKHHLFHFGFPGMAPALSALKEISRRGFCQEGYLLESTGGSDPGIVLGAGTESFQELNDFENREIDRIARQNGGSPRKPEPDPAGDLSRLISRPEKRSLPFYCSFAHAEDLCGRLKGFLSERGVKKIRLISISFARGRELYICPTWEGGEAEYREIQKGLLDALYPAGAFFDMLPYHLSREFLKRNDVYYRHLLKIKKMMDPDNILNPQEFGEL